MRTKLHWMLQQFYGQAEPSPEWWTFIRQNKIDLQKVLPHCGLIGVALCQSVETANGDWMFEFSLAGGPCAVIEGITLHRRSGNLDPYVIDLCAWPLDAPGAWATALGVGKGAELLGGWNCVRPAGSPLVIHPTPLAWLRADCSGCVPLKAGAERWLHKAGGPFVAENADHAESLRQLLGPTGRHHKILIPIPEKYVA